MVGISTPQILQQLSPHRCWHNAHMRIWPETPVQAKRTLTVWLTRTERRKASR
ncbi:MAG TPA: hypothetical protein IGS52_11180 [Oscillatoriaceae cyanobacterium M33_DOE_052]|nr:hypothetical protein [Oscillatoriaceae cyanobacterium M33_DOE_052]